MYDTPKMSINRLADFMGVSVQAIHHNLKVNGITCDRLGRQNYITYSVAKDFIKLYYKKKKIVVWFIRGGAGKSTTVHQLACCLNTYGIKCLAIDADPQHNLTQRFNVIDVNGPVLVDLFNGNGGVQDSLINVTAGLDLIPSTLSNSILDSQLILTKKPLNTVFSDILAPIEGNYDVILIDCSPYLGFTVSAALLYADVLLIPLNQDSDSVSGVETLKKELKNLKDFYKKDVKFKMFFNKFNSHLYLSKLVTKISSDTSLSTNVLQTTVRSAQEIPNSTSKGQDLFTTILASPVRDDFDKLARELFELAPSRG